MRQKFSTPKRLLAATAAMLVLCATAAAADAPALQDRVPDRYEVQKGDTLWGIAGKFLRDPWRWPDVWRPSSSASSAPPATISRSRSRCCWDW